MTPYFGVCYIKKSLFGGTRTGPAHCVSKVYDRENRREGAQWK